MSTHTQCDWRGLTDTHETYQQIDKELLDEFINRIPFCIDKIIKVELQKIVPETIKTFSYDIQKLY